MSLGCLLVQVTSLWMTMAWVMLIMARTTGAGMRMVVHWSSSRLQSTARSERSRLRRTKQAGVHNKME